MKGPSQHAARRAADRHEPQHRGALGRVGMTEKEARERGLALKMGIGEDGESPARAKRETSAEVSCFTSHQSPRSSSAVFLDLPGG
jgi:hypothetical protein